MPSKYGNTFADRVAIKTLKKKGIKFTKYSWLERGSDERQYMSALVNIPTVSVMSSKYREYKEYHTSDDNLNFISSEGLNKNLSIHKEIVNQIEKLEFPITKIICEPNLSKRNLYPSSSNVSKNNSKLKKLGKNINNFLSFADGTNSIEDISTKDEKNYDFTLNKNFISDNSDLYNFKFGVVENKTKSARFGGNEIDGVKNISGNLNYEKWINNFRLSNSTYLRETVAEYDGSVTNENNFVGNNTMFTTQFNLNHNTKNSQNELTLYHNFYDRQYHEQGTNDYYESNATGIKYNFTKFFDNMSYGYGSDYRYDSGEFINNGSYTASTKGNYDNLSVYANLGFNILDKNLLSIFIRNDENKETGSNQSKKINLEREFELFNIGIGRNEGFRNPTIYELYGTDNYGYAGNKNLKEEKSISNEIYLKSNFSNKVSISIKGFNSKINDQIEYKSNKYVNNSESLSLKQSGINSEISITANSYQINIFSSFLSSDKVSGSPQLRRPEKTYGLNLQKNFYNNLFGKFNMNLKYNHYGKHFDTHSSSFSTVEMDSTDLIDVSLNKKIGIYNLSLNTFNLFDEKYQRPHGYSQNDRLFNLTLKTHF